MNETSFHVWTLGLQVISTLVSLGGIAVIIYYVGTHIGTTNTELKYIKSNQEESKFKFDKHIEDDLNFQKEVNTKLTELKVSVVSHGKGAAGT